MARSAKSRGPKSQAVPRSQPNKKERVARWREGLVRLKEEGRLLWLLGHGLDVMLAAEENDGVAPCAGEVAATVAAWARQALLAPPALELGATAGSTPKERPVASQASTVSVATSALSMAETLLDGKPLSGVWCPVLWMGSREWRQLGLITTVLAVGADGRKRALSVRPGSIREPRLAVELLSDLTARGLSINSGVLVVTEGSRTLDDALRQTWGPQVLVSHCRRQLLEDLSSHLVESDRALVCSEVVAAWALAPGEAAGALRRLAADLQRRAPGAAERLQRSIDATLVVKKLGTAEPLQDRLVSLGTVNQAMQQAHVLGDHGGDLADLLAGLSRWLTHTRRVMGWEQLGTLTRAIQEMVGRPATVPENEDCTPNPKAVQRKKKPID